MPNFKQFDGLRSDTLQMGDETGPKLKRSSSTLQASTAAENGFVEFLAAHVGLSSDVNTLTTLLDLMGRVPDIEGQFAGSSAPSPGANTGKFLICSTAGGTYNLHDIVYDSGTALIAMPTNVSRHFTVKAALTGGTAEYIAGGFYAREGSGVALRGDGSGTATGAVKMIRVTYSYANATTDSTTTIPEGAVITRVQNKVTTPFNGTAPTVAVTINGSTPLTLIPAADFAPKTADYAIDNDADIVSVAANNAGAVRVTVGSDGSSAGAGVAYVFYVTPLT